MISADYLKAQIKKLFDMEIKKRNIENPVKHGHIPGNYTGGDPRIIFNGETKPSQKTYKHLSSYQPKAGDHVALARIGRNYVILGKVGDYEGPTGGGSSGANGVGLQYTWSGSRLGVKREDETAYSYADLIGPKGSTGATGAPGPAGKDGTNGTNGVGLQYTWSGTRLGVKRENESSYTFTDLQGPAGATGPAGKDGATGPAGTPGKDGINGTNGKDGTGLQYAWSGTRLGVKREDQSSYSYTDLQGPKGDTGATGPAGKDGATPSITMNALPLASGVSGYSGRPPKYGKFGNLVVLQGAIAAGTTGTIATLPTGYRPAEMQVFATALASGTTPPQLASVSISSAGTVAIEAAAATNKAIHLSGIVFAVE